jgi:phosphotransferase system enzyme I (PtsI)
MNENSGPIRGVAVSKGIARGRAFVLAAEADFVAPKRAVNQSEIPIEIQRTERALAEVRAQLSELQKSTVARLGADVGAIFDAQILMLGDAGLFQKVKQLITTGPMNAEAALSEVIAKYSRAFGDIQDVYLRERAGDIRDLGRRLLAFLIKGRDESAVSIPGGSIVVADELLPSAIAPLQLGLVRGFISERGGKTSHAAILARSNGTPAITGIKDATTLIKPADYVIVDAIAGVILINPKPPVIRQYEKLEAEFEAYRTSLQEVVDVPGCTKDGVAVTLMTNIGMIADVETTLLAKADGVGLYRTEFAFLVRPAFPTEDEQFYGIRMVAEPLHPRPLVVRLLDIGGDKNLPYLPLPRAPNPFLSKRGIRLMLTHRSILKTQLRVLLRASASHPISILVPMVSSVEDVIGVREVLEESKAELKAASIGFNPNIPVGCMIETPAAAIVMPQLARVVDFFSLGTNDLVQYLLAADREDPEMEPYYDPLHPAVLSTLRLVVESARTTGKELSICGEMAGNTMYTELLLGLGLRNFSVAPGELLEIKKVIRSIDSGEASALAQRILGCSTVQEICAELKAAGHTAPCVPSAAK